LVIGSYVYPDLREISDNYLGISARLVGVLALYFVLLLLSWVSFDIDDNGTT